MKYTLFFSVAVLFILAGCSDFTASTRNSDTLYYITGMLLNSCFVDEDNPLFIGPTVAADGGATADMFANDAEVLLHSLDADGTVLESVLLAYDVTVCGYIDAAQEMQIHSGSTYRIEVTMADGAQLHAETTVPTAIDVQADDGFASSLPQTQWPQMTYDTIDSQHPLSIYTADDAEFNLFMEFYCMEEWQDADFINVVIGPSSPESEDEYRGGLNGAPQRLMTFFPYQPENGVVNMAMYQQNFTFYGKHRVSIYAIDANYYHYLYHQDGYSWGGVEGGIGYFGSGTGTTVFTEVIE